MKVLLASSSSGSRGGGEMYLVYLGRALAQLGHQVSLWASAHARMDELCALFSPIGRVYRSAYRNTYDRRGRSLEAWFDLAAAREIEREWRALDFDVLHVNKQNLEDGLDMLNAARWLHRPSVCTVHLSQTAHYLGAKMPWIRDAVARLALRRFPGSLITVIEERNGDLSKFLGSGARVVTIPNGVPIFTRNQLHAGRAGTREMLDADDETLLIIAVGRMVEQKRPLLFVQMARQVLERIPRARFVWIGDGPLAQEWDRAADGVDRIARLPWQSDVLPYFGAADVFLHVAEFEGLPLALLEAMAAGLPCAITRNLLSEMPFLNESNSLTADETGDAWLDVLQDPMTLKSRGNAARELVKRQFSYQEMARACETVYRREIAAHS